MSVGFFSLAVLWLKEKWYLCLAPRELFPFSLFFLYCVRSCVYNVDQNLSLGLFHYFSPFSPLLCHASLLGVCPQNMKHFLKTFLSSFRGTDIQNMSRERKRFHPEIFFPHHHGMHLLAKMWKKDYTRLFFSSREWSLHCYKSCNDAIHPFKMPYTIEYSFNNAWNFSLVWNVVIMNVKLIVWSFKGIVCVSFLGNSSKQSNVQINNSLWNNVSLYIPRNVYSRPPSTIILVVILTFCIPSVPGSSFSP